ncbi:MAG: aldehyde dehydrogenase family protein [Wenzhouxiangellaceae bacterium]
MSLIEKYQSMDYGPAPENNQKSMAWLDSHQRRFGLYINGRWQQPASESWFDSHDPATGEALAAIAQADADDVDKAVRAARRAQKNWAALGGHGRARYLYALARLVQKHSRQLAVLEAMDNGKTIRETRDIDIPLVARHFYHHAGWAQLQESEFPGYEPHGVAGQVIPWNFPLLMLAWKVAPALAAGNTVVIKPAEYTSLSALMFAELAMEAGLPRGVLNIITGDGRTGELIVKHPGVDKIAFTGSTEVGKIIRRELAGSGKALTLELGGKSPFIVFEDADLDSAVEGLVDAIWFNQGQVCCAGSRLLMQEGVADRLVAKIKARMDHLRVGSSLDKGMDMGAIVDPVQRQRIDQLVQQGVREGATLWQPECELPDAGCYYPPTLLTNADTSNIAVREEIFGPVLVAMTFRTQQEAVELANNSRYGLAASVWSDNINRALEVAPQLKAGVVWINSTNQFDAAAGFGGYRESGFGREGGKEGMYAYLKPSFEKQLKTAKPPTTPRLDLNSNIVGLPGIDRTAKHYIGGKQARPDGGNSLEIADHQGRLAGLVAEGNYKDIRNAVEAASKAVGWSHSTGHLRAQILYYLAENLSYRATEFAERISRLSGFKPAAAELEVELAIQRLFTHAAWADKYDGQVHSPPLRGVTLAMNEALGVMGIVCPDESPLLAMISLLAPAMAMGNRVVLLPSERYPLVTTDFYQLLETSDVPAGVVNIVTGHKNDLALVLAKHNNVDGLWCFSDSDTCTAVEYQAAENMKRTWLSNGLAYDWHNSSQTSGELLLRRACEVKNIWIPWGDAS